MRYSRFDLNEGTCTIGALLGTAGSSEYLKQVQMRDNKALAFFGTDTDPMRTQHMHFMQQVITPMVAANIKLQQAKLTVEQPDTFIPINTTIGLCTVPPCMQPAILMYRPVYELLQDGKIDGYGYDPKSIPDDDPYSRLITNGRVELIPGSDVFNSKGEFEFVSEFTSIDPDMSFEDLDALEITRKFIDKFMEDEDTSFRDPTNPTELRG